MAQWATGFRKTSTHRLCSVQVEEPVDSFVDNLREGKETALQLSFNSLQRHSTVALMRAQEHWRLPPLGLF